MRQVFRFRLCIPFLLGVGALTAQATPGSHLHAKPAPGKVTPQGIRGIDPGKPVTVLDCGVPCRITIKVTLQTTGGKTSCDFNYAEVALALVDKKSPTVTWHVEASPASSKYKFTFVPMPASPTATKDYGVFVADNTEPINPNDPMGQRRWVWVDDSKASTDTDLVKTIATGETDRRFKTSYYVAFIQWEDAAKPGSRPTACGPMDPIIMNDGM